MGGLVIDYLQGVKAIRIEIRLLYIDGLIYRTNIGLGMLNVIPSQEARQGLKFGMSLSSVDRTDVQKEWPAWNAQT